MIRAEISDLHNTYLEEADMRIALLANTERLWLDFIAEGRRVNGDPLSAQIFTKDGMILVVRYLKRKNKKLRASGLSEISLRLDKLIGDPDVFNNYWGEADKEHRTNQRKWKPGPKEQALAQWRREDVRAQCPTKDAEQAIGPTIRALQEIQEKAIQQCQHHQQQPTFNRLSP